MIEMKPTKDVHRRLQATLLGGAKIPHRISKPVLYQENGRYYLAVFVFFYTKEDLDRGTLDRPTLWAIADLATGRIIEERPTTTREFSDAPYEVKYGGRFQAPKEIIFS